MPGRVETGIVERLDRDNHVAYVQAQGSAVMADVGTPAQRPVLPAKYRGEPPPPLSFVDCEQINPGVWRLNGILGDHRVLLHDDFTSTAAGTSYGDTPWTGIGSAGGAQQASSSDALGAILLFTGPGAGSSIAVVKDANSIAVPAAGALWCSFRSAPFTTPGGGNIQHAGLANNPAATLTNGAFDIAASIYYDTAFGSALNLNARVGVSAVGASIPFVPTSGAYYVVDLVLVGGQFLAGWVNGSGPYVVTGSTVPAVASGVQPYFGVYDGSNSDVSATAVDWMHVEAFDPLAVPGRDLIVPGSNIIS